MGTRCFRQTGVTRFHGQKNAAGEPYPASETLFGWFSNIGPDGGVVLEQRKNGGTVHSLALTGDELAWVVAHRADPVGVAAYDAAVARREAALTAMGAATDNEARAKLGPVPEMPAEPASVGKARAFLAGR